MVSRSYSQSPNQQRFSRQGFHPLNPEDHDMSYNNNNDATIDIPLQQVTSNGQGLRNRSTVESNLEHTKTNDTKASEKRRLFRGRRTQTPDGYNRKKNIGYDGEEDTVNTMGKIYDKIVHFSVITRYLVYVAPLALIIAIPIIIGATIAPNARIGGVQIVWFFTWVEVVWLSLWASKAVCHYLPWLFEILAGVVSSGVRKYSMVIRRLEIPLSLVGWSVTALATFVPVMTLNPSKQAAKANGHEDATAIKHWEAIVQKILAAAVVASLIYVVEKFIIQLISINYHRKQFNARIKDSKRNVYLLGLLYEASRRLFPAYCNEFAEEDYMIADQLNISLGLTSKRRSGHARSGSATPMRLIQDVGRFGDKLTSAFGNVAQEITGKEVFNPNSAHSIVVEALEKKRTSEALARRIWMSLVLEGREALFRDDIIDVLGPNRSEEAEEAFAALDGDGNGDISLEEMILAVTAFSAERKSIANSMHDVDQAINVLDRLLMTVVAVAIVFIFIAFLNANFVTTLATTGTALLSLSFVFSVTCQEVLGSCVFLFVKHPYDIGDRVDIGENQFVVEHISLLFSVFRRVTGTGVGRLTQVPNIVLNTLWIENVTRSKAMTEQLKIDVSFDTSFEDIQILKNELQKFVIDKDNSRDFQPEVEVAILGTSDQSKLSLQVEIKHKSNWSNESIRQARRSKFMCALVSALKAVPIYAPGGGGDASGSPENPSYSVSVSAEEAKRSVAASAKAKEAARLVPTKAPDATSPAVGPAGMTEREGKIVDSLTVRDPTLDVYRDDVAWTSSRDDSSTLNGGERASFDHQDITEMKSALRRGSTRGKRKPGVSPSLSGGYSDGGHGPSAVGGWHASVPTIEEPAGQSDTSYGGPYTTNYPPQISPLPPAASPFYQPSSLTQTMSHGHGGSPSRQPSNPYMGGGVTHSTEESEKEDEENPKPYSGV
ncbi:putative mscs family protein c2c4.17c [Acrodontium crateriforme]|uniref:Mscs family protein c2c4.17c n=1 Tax=Acrodontium crateriforme TaxID=150365 RepID=A0AAQ3MBG8_9PEZI|nr:putative mscs family protein c2c4.17c [Acrodontium crateriforme]